ncbi:flavodoxin family protein [Nocardioides alcanivorans]|uniref:flavodoxin family protein n=1 Tax=Nocardioides alcanivorans TaxID=2897352 RepID=UPI001F1FC399|nr:NAD(P)H-dependent oxidoreductase [Nocardioides alcanivorans]
MTTGELLRIGVVIGSGHGMAGTTGALVQELLDRVADLTATEVTVVETETLRLGGSCSACLSCMTDGEATCPNIGNSDPATTLLDTSDLVVFATPVHSFHVSATMKRFVDHYAYLIHRPRHFGTPAVLISTAAGAGHDAALGYLAEATRRWGFHTIAQLGVNGPALARAPYRARVDTALAEIAETIVDGTRNGKEPTPSTKDLIGFRVARLLVQGGKDEGSVDEAYWNERNWFDADWFTDAKVPKLANRLAAIIEGRIRSAIEKGSNKPFRG